MKPELYSETELEKLRKLIKKAEKEKQVLTKDVDAQLNTLISDLAFREKQKDEDIKKNKISLEEKFNAFVNETQDKINEHLRLAEEEIKKAVEISEETGVAFETDLIMNFKRNSYVPHTFKKLKNQYPDDIVDNFIYDNFDGLTGWKSDGWSSSSLSC